MFRFSRLALALTVAASACDDMHSVSSPSGYVANDGVAAPRDLNAFFPPYGSIVVISWSYDGRIYHPEITGFMVERASDADGAWSLVAFTADNSVVDSIGDGIACYRVTAMVSATVAASQPSPALCVRAP